MLSKDNRIKTLVTKEHPKKTAHNSTKQIDQKRAVLICSLKNYRKKLLPRTPPNISFRKNTVSKCSSTKCTTKLYLKAQLRSSQIIHYCSAHQKSTLKKPYQKTAKKLLSKKLVSKQSTLKYR